jgi:hypothetical protein
MAEQFPTIPSSEPIKEVIHSAFDLSIELSGGWGYSIQEAIEILPPLAAPLSQIEYTLASVRTHLDMHMMLPEEERYGGINLNEKTRESLCANNRVYELVTYEVTAMKERNYARFIDAYKEGYGQEDFDMDAHFRARKEATLTRSITLYFDITAVQ